MLKNKPLLHTLHLGLGDNGLVEKDIFILEDILCNSNFLLLEFYLNL